MKALVIAAHGSRKKETALEVEALVERLAKKAADEFHFVEHAFLQFTEPGLEEVMETLVQRGAKKIFIFPFFIAVGTHVLQDLPECIEKAQKTHPGVDFIITRHLGALESIEDVILNEVREGVPRPEGERAD